jgi:hypothetical protein
MGTKTGRAPVIAHTTITHAKINVNNCIRGELPLVGWVIRDIYNIFSTCWRNLQKHALFVCRIVFSCFSVNFPFTCQSLYKGDVTLFTPCAKIRDHPENNGMYRQSDTCCHNMDTNYCNSHYAYCQLLSAYCHMRL